MITDEQKQEFYQALLDKNTHYEGIFFVGVKTTGAFCRPTCPARKPKLGSVDIYLSHRKIPAMVTKARKEDAVLS